MVPRVIIVGGGFGGLSAARALRGAAVRVTLIDKRNYHLFRPMLYQVATGLLSDDEISGPLRSILSRQENIDVLLDEVTGISPKQHLVHLKHRASAGSRASRDGYSGRACILTFSLDLPIAYLCCCSGALTS
jgi:NADH dehydrogenase FAD-containing subunit